GIGKTWTARPHFFEPENMGWTVNMHPEVPGFDDTVAALEYDYEGRTSRHVASWHPAVALAVAQWLDGEAGKQTPTSHLAVAFDGTPMFPVDPHAVAVAQAYLNA